MENEKEAKNSYKKERNFSDGLEETAKNILKPDYYMRIQAKSIGQHKARNEALFQLKGM